MRSGGHNNKNGTDGYCIENDKFRMMYKPVN